MLIPMNLEQMNRRSSYLLPCKIFLDTSVAIGTRHVGLCLFTDFDFLL